MCPDTPIRILLVDDEASVLFALRLLLEALQYSVSEFTSPLEAISELEQHSNKYDLVLCDLKMPKLSGFDVLTKVREISADIPFILMSAHATTGDIKFAHAHGASEFIAKPFTPEQLKKTIDRTILPIHSSVATG